MNTTETNELANSSHRVTSRPLLLGHRGTTINARENTFEAFDRALADGCDGIEFDVRVTRDSRAIICHDPSYAHYEIAESTLDSLQAVGASPPMLSDVLRIYGQRCFLYVELKAAGAERELLSILRDDPPVHGYVVASFHPEILTPLHDLDCEVPLGFICGTRRHLKYWSQLPVQYVMLKESLATPAHISALHSAGKRVFAWTVNKEKHMRSLARLGVDGILSDDTRLLVRT